MFSGAYAAIITPFDDNNQVDVPKITELVKFLTGSGVEGIVPCGTTGESVTLSDDERILITETVAKCANKRWPVIAGAGTNSTEHSIHMSKKLEKAGADALLIVTPYYNKPTQEGLYLHYKAIAGAVQIPLVIYNVPGRTACNILPATVIRLMNDCPNITCIKEASGSTDQATEILSKAKPGFSLLSGDDSLTLPLMAAGASGVISVVANIAPREVRQMCDAVKNKDYSSARKLHEKLYSLTKACFIETNPIPVKTALEMMGFCKANLRLPLCGMSKANAEKLAKALSEFGLIKK